MRQGFRAWQALPGLFAAAACVVVLGCGTRSSSPGSAGSARASAQTSESEKAKEANKLTKENFDKVKDNMTEKQVLEILGPPTETKEVGKDADKSRQLTWKSGSASGTVVLDKEGKVTANWFQNVSITIK